MGSTEDIPQPESQYGFRIYNLIKNGPLYNGGAKEISDFIIPPSEILSQNNNRNSFNDWIISISNKNIKIKLYSLLERDYKYIEIKTNPQGTKEGILGAAVKYENYLNADKNLLHILKVNEDSFAKKKLGLIPDDDYIIAVKTKNAPIIPLNKEEYNPLEILNIILSNNNGNEMIFYIYNKNNGNRVVETKIEKNETDNKFILGCDVAYGALHEFPKVQKEIIIKNNNLNNNNDNNNKKIVLENRIKEIKNEN